MPGYNPEKALIGVVFIPTRSIINYLQINTLSTARYEVNLLIWPCIRNNSSHNYLLYVLRGFKSSVI